MNFYSRPVRLRVIFLISLAAMIGSLYFWLFGDPLINALTGDRRNRENALKICDLCRYARILIYPLVLLSGMALYRRDYSIRVYIAPFALLGIILEWYQRWMMLAPEISLWFCDPENPCTAPYLNYFGFITIPFLSFLAFLVIGLMILRGANLAKKLSLTTTPRP